MEGRRLRGTVRAMSNDFPLASTAESSRPELAVPARPQRPLSPLKLLKTVASDTIGMFDEQLFDELVVVRRYGPAAVAYVSDPAGICTAQMR